MNCARCRVLDLECSLGAFPRPQRRDQSLSVLAELAEDARGAPPDQLRPVGERRQREGHLWGLGGEGLGFGG